MRRMLARTMTTLAATLAIAACGELAQQPLVLTTPLAVQLRFPDADGGAHSVFGADIDHVRLGLYRQSEETVIDTVIAWPLNRPDFAYTLDVPLAQRAETLYLYVDLMAGQSTRYYASHQIVVEEEVLPALPPLELIYYGPGYDATSFSISPRGGFMMTGSTRQFTGSAYNGQGQLLTTPVAWSVTDTRLATIDADGLLTARSQNGSLYVRAAIANGLKDSVLVQVSDIPSVKSP